MSTTSSVFHIILLSYYEDYISFTIYLKLFKFYSSSGTYIAPFGFSFRHRFHKLQRFQHLSNTRCQNWILSENKSRQKWAHQSESLCIYFLGFISLLCVRDLHCFNSFIICNWLAISSGYISSVNWGQLNPIRLVEKPAFMKCIHYLSIIVAFHLASEAF